MTYFQNCSTLLEVKTLYKTLAKQLHPDLGGSTEAMQKLNAEYSFVCAKLAKGENLSQEETEATILQAEAYREALEKVIHLQGVQVELVGNWIWITGNTFPVKDIIKQAKFMFASAKKAWFFRTEEFKAPSGGKVQSLDQIKSKYGSVTINYKAAYQLG